MLKAYASLDKALVQYAELYDFAPVGYLTIGFSAALAKPYKISELDKVVASQKS